MRIYLLLLLFSFALFAQTDTVKVDSSSAKTGSNGTKSDSAAQAQSKLKYGNSELNASLTINTFNRARVFLNGELVENNTPVKLPSQEIDVRVEMEGAKTLEKHVTLGAKDDKMYNMFPDYPTGAVQINPTPKDADIEVWEEGVEKYTGSGNKLISNIPAGKYNLKVSRNGFRSQTSEITIGDGSVVKKDIKLKKGSDVGGEYILVEGGTFEMGSSENGSDEKRHKVTVSDFYIGKFEITQSEWYAMMEKEPGKFKGQSLPIENVDWYDAVNFCNRLSENEGYIKCYSGTGKSIVCDFSANGYRLPTEAEWEYAARGGKNAPKYRYSGSDNIEEVAVYDSKNVDSPKKIASKKANDLGIFDMSGNVAEWCWDWYNPYPEEQQNNPKGPDYGFLKVVRGGSWFVDKKFCRVSYRNLYNPSEKFFFLGLRVVRSK